MADLGFELILRFLWGSLIILSTISRKETSERFPRIAAYIAFGTSLFAAFLVRDSEFNRTYFLILSILVSGAFLYAFFSPRLLRILGFMALVFAPLPFWVRQNFGDILNFILSGMLFGGVFAGQYLGHWFLTVPNLNIRELQRVIKILIVALGLKTTEAIVSLSRLYHHSTELFGGIDEMGRPLGTKITNSQIFSTFNPVNSLMGIQGESFLGLGFFGLMILISRLLWGILAPCLLVYMVKKTVDMRSTQSATGILYALCVMIILGEGAALYLHKTMGWNL